MFILKKTIDWSVLTDGITLPVWSQPIINQLKGGIIEKGHPHPIKIWIDKDVFDATLINVNFDKSKYKTHSDVLQIRYSKNSLIAQRLQTIFSECFAYITSAKRLPENKKKQIKLPENYNEYITLTATDLADTYILDYYTTNDHKIVKNHICDINEYEFEISNFEPIQDKTAGIVEKTITQKVRKLDRSITETLKKLYDYKCQITGENVGHEYGSQVVEAHHIEYFTKSLNNDTSNIIIINPTFHRIIHQISPIFDRKTLSFIFPNGVIETIKLNKHLN